MSDDLKRPSPIPLVRLPSANAVLAQCRVVNSYEGHIAPLRRDRRHALPSNHEEGYREISRLHRAKRSS